MNAGYPDFFRGFPSSLQTNAGTLSHYRLFRNPLQLISHPQHSTLYRARGVKQHTTTHDSTLHGVATGSAVK
jgi:hypothetical protein